MKNKKTIGLIICLLVIFTVIGGTLAFWTWNSTVNTNLAFTVTRDFSCSADGGGDIVYDEDDNSVGLIPVNVDRDDKEIPIKDRRCTITQNVIKRTITVSATVAKDDLNIGTDLWLTVNSIDNGLSNSNNLRYAISTEEDSCLDGMKGFVYGGNFNGLTAGEQLPLLSNVTFTKNNLTPKTYYLYIWLDAAESDESTQGKKFSLSLGGECSDTPQANKPELPSYLYPVTIADNGTVTRVSEDDSEWYNYNNKEWANAVEVNNDFENVSYEGYDDIFAYLNSNVDVEIPEEYIINYYVWIPRYKYKISTNTACSNINNLTLESYPECYKNTTPYTLTISEQKFIEKTETSLFDAYNLCNYWEVGIVDGSNCTDDDIAFFDKLFNTGSAENDFNRERVFLAKVLDSDDYEVAVEMNDKIISHKGSTTIDITFESKNASMTLDNATTDYRTHPAFWWDNDNDSIVDSNENLSGIWVGKFEATSGNSNNSHQFSTLPNATPLTGLKIGAFFSKLKVGDSHMIKNSEWGAVAYLSHSKYGINKEVRLNNYTLTGCGASTENASKASKCDNAYGGKNISVYPQSTTGNISGIFDMSGGRNEYVMGHYGSTSFNTFSSIPEKKYYDLYSPDVFIGIDHTNLNYCTLEICGGHALDETAGWYNDNMDGAFVSTTSNKRFFVRGGIYNDNEDPTKTGIFAFNDQTGTATSFASRSVIVLGY